MEDSQLIELYQGDGVVVFFPFADTTGAPCDMTAHEAMFVIHSSSKKEVVLKRPMSLDMTLDNIMHVKLNPEDTKVLSGNYTYYIQVTKATKLIRVVAKGPLKIHITPDFT